MKLPPTKRPPHLIDSKDSIAGDAWVIVTAVWKESLRNTSGIQSADACATGLTDIMHSAGTARIATISAFIAVGLWSVLDVCGLLKAHSGLMPSSRFYGGFSIAMTIVSIVIAAVVGVLLLVLHNVNYRRTGELTERLIDRGAVGYSMGQKATNRRQKKLSR